MFKKYKNIFFRLNDAALARLLQKTFATRYKLILENAHNMRGADVSEFTPHLTAEENYCKQIWRFFFFFFVFLALPLFVN